MTVTTERRYFNPLEWLRHRVGDVSHITYDPDVQPQYRIIRGSTHDGTFLFTEEMIWQALTPLAARMSYWKGAPPDDTQTLSYIVGRARIATVYGLVDLPAGRFPGQRERITVPVRCIPS